MKSKIEDIRQIRAKTENYFSIAECKELYEKNGCNVEKTVEILKSKTPATVEPTAEERAEIESRRAKSDKKAKNTAGRKTERVIAAKVYCVFAWFCLIMFIASIITGLIIGDFSSFVIPIVLFLLLSIVLAVVSGSLNGMTEEEYSEAKKVVSNEITYNDGDEIVCPYCGSTHVTFHKKGFNEGKALLGVALIGYWGAFWGVPGKNKIKGTCLKCGHSWATFAACCVIFNGFMGYQMGYENITVDTVNYMQDQKDLMQQLIEYASTTPEPQPEQVAEDKVIAAPEGTVAVKTI